MISSSVTPSIAAWWIFVMIAKLPAGSPATSSSPSMTYISHNGLLRSSGRECSRATWMQNCRQSPGRGSAMCRTWYSRSKSGSSIQYG